ncbi:MAG: phospholipase D-like domain-containing protein [Candidatus Asgardarchaeia archaeon]
MKHGIVELVKNEEHERLFKEMRKTKRELLLASAIIKDFYILDPLGNPFRLSRILSNLAKNRVDVKILTTPKMRERLFFENLMRIGESVQIRFCPRIHIKIVIRDNDFAYFGSANLTGAGLGMKSAKKRNFEIGAFTQDPNLIQEMRQTFYNIWQGDMCKVCYFFKRNKCPGVFNT